MLKNCKYISIKMSEDVGMRVPKSREKSAVYMQDEGSIICSKTGDEDSIYAARQGMRTVYMQQDRA